MTQRQTPGGKPPGAKGPTGHVLGLCFGRTAPGGSDLHYDACPAGCAQLGKSVVSAAGPATQGDPSKTLGDTGQALGFSPRRG